MTTKIIVTCDRCNVVCAEHPHYDVTLVTLPETGERKYESKDLCLTCVQSFRLWLVSGK